MSGQKSCENCKFNSLDSLDEPCFHCNEFTFPEYKPKQEKESCYNCKTKCDIKNSVRKITNICKYFTGGEMSGNRGGKMKIKEELDIKPFEKVNSCYDCKYNNDTQDCLNPDNTKQNPCKGKMWEETILLNQQEHKEKSK